jgi:hypothetical protein
MKRMALDAIHDDLVRTLGKYAVAYSTVTKYARSAQFSGRKEATPPEVPDVEGSSVDEAITTALAEFPFPFSSVRELSRRICLPRSTVHRHLTQSLRFTVRHLRIRIILAEIPREILNAVFLEWIERLQKCMQVDDEYVG